MSVNVAVTVFGALYASTGGNVVAPLTSIAVVMALGGVVLAVIGPETKGQAFV